MVAELSSSECCFGLIPGKMPVRANCNARACCELSAILKFPRSSVFIIFWKSASLGLNCRRFAS